ncbi:carbonic anhydrase [Rhabdochromatium marinum]|uniref:carbonic anhydrase n=1 Tax=Rhabdochromatium marinum TaxID=48729 RepID=UPI001903D59B|nr:carbonic anhydrase [Rhabdochromatium marinum]MBK1649203.1 carbonate dehydratase [Rhabdochromatium marinum]
MKINKKFAFTTSVLGTLVASSAAFAGAGPHWGYEGEEGPSHWGELDANYAVCASGRNQAPIDVHDAVDAELPPVEFHYKAGGWDEVNNGHSIQVNYQPGSSIKVNGHRYELKQFHFHTPSENHVEGHEFPLEAHLVHADADGNLAVIAVMFEQGETNQALADAWEEMPEHADEHHKLLHQVSAEALLPSSHEYYRFNGSLTTPPCSEGVLWLVMKEPVTASAEQIEHFAKVMGHPNNRPIQPTNARMVVQ